MSEQKRWVKVVRGQVVVSDGAARRVLSMGQLALLTEKQIRPIQRAFSTPTREEVDAWKGAMRGKSAEQAAKELAERKAAEEAARSDAEKKGGVSVGLVEEDDSDDEPETEDEDSGEGDAPVEFATLDYQTLKKLAADLDLGGSGKASELIEKLETKREEAEALLREMNG